MGRAMIIRNAAIVSMDPEIGTLSKGDVLIQDGIIVAVKPNIEISDAEEMDASGNIVIPGLVDGHRHLWQGAMRAVCADWTLMDYVTGIRANAANFYGPEDMHATQFHGALEALDAGVTTVADYCHNHLTPEHSHEAIRGMIESGIRSVWCYGFNRPPGSPYARQSQADRAALGRDLASRYFTSKDALLTLGVCPEESLFWDSDQTGIDQFNFARELDARVFWHANATAMPTGHTHDVIWLHAHDLLSSEITFVHMNATDTEEWKLVADSGAGVAFTPDTELQMGMGWSPTEVCTEFAIPQAYGIDITSNNSGDFFTCLRMALQTARCRVNSKLFGSQFVDRLRVTAEEALSWGTIQGARAIGMEDKIGSLTPGKQADLAIINTDSLTMVGWNQLDPIGSVVMQAHARDVDTVIVGGKVVKREGRMLADVGKAKAMLLEASERLSKKVSDAGGYLVHKGQVALF